MKLAAVRIVHAAETIKGGVATILKSLLADQSEDPVCIPIALIPDRHAMELDPISSSFIATFRSHGRGFRTLLSFALSLRRLIASHQPHILHLHSTFAGFIGRLVLLTFRPSKRPHVIYCPHAFPFLMQTSPLQKSLYRALERLLSRITDRIICVSQFEYREALLAGLPHAKLLVIYNGINPPLAPFRPSRTASNSTNLLFVGRFDRQKGFDILQMAMQRLPEHYHLTAVGAPVHGTAFPSPASNITYTGWLPPLQLAEYYRSADLVIMPSRWESFGLVAIEAASYGTPTLAPDIAAFPELIDNCNTGLLFDGTVSGLVAAITTSSPDQLMQLGKAARQHYKHKFASSSMCLLTRQLYNDVLSQKGKSGQ